MRSFFKRIAIVAATCAFASSAFADTASELTTMLNAVQTMQANFTQTVYDNNQKPVQQSLGKMSMQRPGKFRWQVTKPMPQLIIANQSKLWIYDPDLEQLTIRSLKQSAGETPALLLSEVNEVLTKYYTIKDMTPPVAGERWFALKPLGEDNMFAVVQLGFKQNQISAMRLQDHLGHQTRIEFKQIVTNKPISPATFTFKPPANTDVIDETSKKQNN